MFTLAIGTAFDSKGTGKPSKAVTIALCFAMSRRAHKDEKRIDFIGLEQSVNFIKDKGAFMEASAGCTEMYARLPLVAKPGRLVQAERVGASGVNVPVRLFNETTSGISFCKPTGSCNAFLPEWPVCRARLRQYQE